MTETNQEQVTVNSDVGVEPLREALEAAKRHILDCPDIDWDVDGDLAEVVDRGLALVNARGSLDAAGLRERLERLPRFGVVNGLITPHPKGLMVRLDDVRAEVEA